LSANRGLIFCRATLVLLEGWMRNTFDEKPQTNQWRQRKIQIMKQPEKYGLHLGKHTTNR